MNNLEKSLNEVIKTFAEKDKLKTNNISDGYHTFGELYEHRIALFIAFCNAQDHDFGYPVWKSKQHFDGTVYDGWFIAGIYKEKGKQISYHLPINKWDLLKVEELEKAPEWDGHTPADVVERLLKL